jgi:predicted nucleotidyltransferase
MAATTSPDYTPYLRTARRRAQAARASTPWAERREKAWAVARRAAEFIRVHYPDARVRLFGSLLYPDSFGPKSDIDLAVEGIDWPDYLRLWGMLERREPEFEIDLVDVGIVSAGLRAHIERDGMTL